MAHSRNAVPDPADAQQTAPDLLEVRLVGRGGQGIVTAGDLLGRAAVGEGRWAQSIPTFGPERRGALTTCTLRISDEEILLKCTTARPSVLLVLDPTIWHHANVLLGLREGATLIFNTPRAPGEVEDDLVSHKRGYGLPVADYEIFTVDATGIALETMGRPITNTAMMGAFVGATERLSMASVEAAIAERFERAASANLEAARAARARLKRGAP
jgi:2-oxoacid:acceptor oxidoreductase gamma subunit (pyruvate/2-ketoisovalerate family)